MANVYPYEPNKWTYNSTLRMSSNAFRFTGVGAYAKATVTGTEVGELGGELFFRGFLSPPQKNLTQGLRCKIDIFSKQDDSQIEWTRETHYVYLKADRNNALNTKIATYGGTFDHMDITLETLYDTQFGLDGSVELTSFIIGNASGTSGGIDQATLDKNLPLLIWDVNRVEQSNNGGDAEVFVGILPVNSLRDNADVDAGFRTHVTLSDDGVLTERFYRDGIEELFSPVVMDMPKGRHLISDDHAYLALASGSHTFLATLQFEGGTMDIDTRKTMYTIETSRVGTRDIAIDGKAISLALSGVLEKSVPHEIWVLTQDTTSNVLYIVKGNYDTDSSLISLSNDIEYPLEVIYGSIEFEGFWTKQRGALRLVSEKTPKSLLIWSDGSLRYGNYNKPDNPTHIIESGSVLDCAMVRGWNVRETTGEANDMGMVIAYIRSDGKAYYKTIIDEVQDITRNEIVFSGAVLPLKNIEVFRTNDYRVGFTATDANDDLYTVLTARYYQGDAVESVLLESSFTESSNYAVRDDTVPVKALNPVDGQHIEIYWNNLLDEREPMSGISLVDSSIPPKVYIPDYVYKLEVNTPWGTEYKAGDVITADIFTIIATEDNFNEFTFTPLTGLADKDLEYEPSVGGSDDGATINVSSKRGVIPNKAMSLMVTTQSAGTPTKAYLTGYGLMTEKFPNAGIDGYIEPLKLVVNNSDGKSLIHDFGNQKWVNRPIENFELDVSNLSAEGTPDNPIPDPLEQDRADQNIISMFGANNMVYTINRIIPSDKTGYSDEKLVAVPHLSYTVNHVQFIIKEAQSDDYRLTAGFDVGYTVNKFTINDIPV